MSASLMSCVRENSPPLDVVDGANCCSASGPMSLPDCHMSTMSTKNQQQLTSTPLSVTNMNESSSSGGGAGGGGGGTATNTEPKRRRFHPLRNLRRIFRRRTITSVADTPPSPNSTNTLPPPTSSNSEKNLRSATLSSISSVVSASSPSSPLTHQQLQDAYLSQSLPKSKSYSIGGGSGGGSIGTVLNSGGSTKSPHRDALLASALSTKQHQKHLQTKQQLAQQLQQQLEEAVHESGEMYTTTSSMYHHHQHQQVGSSGGVLFQPPHSVRQSLGVAVLPSAMNRSFYAERQKLRSVGDSSQELDSSGNDSGSATGTTSVNNTSGASGGRTNDCASNEMTDSQRSLSEGRLVDSDYSHDPLSQSHDSVFSESASASLFSNRDYQAELSDVLRKRNRNRPDASEEDLGLPRSPASPQRRAERTTRSHNVATGSGQQSTSTNNNIATTSSSAATGNQSEVSSLSLLSMNSGDGDEILAASTANNSTISTKDIMQERTQTSTTSGVGRSITRSSTVSTTSVASEIYRHSSSGSLGSFDSSRDEPDLLDAKCQRLSHSAAKHKMALRPAKKKGPSRQHRRTLETSIPEANEENLRLANTALLDIAEHDIKAKTRSLPPGVNTKILDKHAVDAKKLTSPTKSKTKSSMSSNEQALNVKRSKIEKFEKTESSKTTASTSSISTNSSTITAATNLFGLRTLTAKATALFEPPQESSTDPTPSEQELKKEREKEKERVKEKPTNNVITETTESGFLRRLIQRNSKRSMSRPSPPSNNSVNVSPPMGEDKIDLSQSEGESKSKMQISTSYLDMKTTPESSLTKLDKTRSALSYEQNIEETRKDIKREIMSVGNTGLNAMLNTQNLLPAATNNAKETTIISPTKPKSGAAARQRYVPQEITSSLDRKVSAQPSATNTTATTSDSYTSSTSSLLSKCSQQEIFQSTSIIREITASQASSVNSLSSLHNKSEHHFEKKPKIVGLSAFQQKISRSNDSVGRYANYGSANSTSSLDAVGDVLTFKSQEPEKQRKLVEKSRSFRTYQEDSSYATTNSVHNNMPSLPDLTLNLRVPCYNEFPLKSGKQALTVTSPDRCTSLGYEVNEPAPVRIFTPRTESTGNLTASNYNFSKNIAVKSSPTKLVSLSQSSASSGEPDEINTDLLLKSPFINVLRKPNSTTSLEEKPAIFSNNNRKSIEPSVASIGSSISLIAVVPPSPEMSKVVGDQHQLRPKVLHLRDSNTSIETSTSTDDLNITPTTAPVFLREKSKIKSNVSAGANVRNSLEILSASTKDLDRKSAPAPMLQASKAQQSYQATRRSTSLMDNPPNNQNGTEERNAVVKITEPTSGSSTPNGEGGVPEFMRIQLNRVDPARIAKSANVVLSKNVRDTPTPAQQQMTPQQQQQQQITKESNERNSNLEDLCLRRLSNESVEIIEKLSPTEVDKQKAVFEMNQNSGNNNNKSPTKANVVMNALPPRSPVKKQAVISAITPTTPTTPTTPIDIEDNVLLRGKSLDAPLDANTLSSNNLSLHERKRLFLNEEKLKTDKRIEELRNERKKSITEEVYRKSFAKSEEKLETSEKAATESVVMMRKKSFCATTQASATTTNGKRDDSTPELMKVFARRSLKIKDEDINALADKLHASNGSVNSAKKFASTQQNVDSDKENQSASDEKLDMLPKLEAPVEAQIFMGSGGSKVTNGINNRNSLADFRMKSVGGSGALSNGLNNSSSNNNNNINNNNNNNTAAISNNTTSSTNGGVGSRASFLPPIKVAGFRAIPIERNNSVSKIYQTTAAETLNNNNNNNSSSNNLSNNNNHTNQQSHQQYHHHPSTNGKSNERQSLNIKMLECSSNASSCSTSVNNSNNKTIERSATVSEFKGIHQRRAEWEQRAKEALK